MAIVTVWLFLILGATPLSTHQAVDNFPTRADCEAFRLSIQQMLDQGLATGSRVSDCLPRVMVSPQVN